MKALTMRQPWLSLLIDGEKPCEYRSWSTSYRGPVLLHAGRARDTTMDARVCDDAPRGVIVAQAMLDAIYHLTAEDAEVLTTDHETPVVGAYAWWFSRITPLPQPIPYRGALGLWEARIPL